MKYGHSEFLVMPMGFCNAPATFQTLLNQIFWDCMDDFGFIFMDDLLIFSKSVKDHYEHSKTVLRRLLQHELYVGNNNCDLFKSETEFLGLKVNSEGIQIGEDRISVIKDSQKPTTVT